MYLQFADVGMRVGPEYQATIPDYLPSMFSLCYRLNASYFVDHKSLDALSYLRSCNVNL